MIRAFLTVILTALLLFASPVTAQETNSINYDQWNTIADQAEKLVGDSDASSDALSQTRAAVVEWRSRFQEGQNVNADRIDSVRQQIEALGAAPAEGQTEDAEIAARREELNKQLSELQAPRLTAVEAFSRANAIVKSIDEVQADRQATETAKLSPSPLLPSSWKEAANAALQIAKGFLDEVEDAGDQESMSAWQQLRPQLPTVLAYLIAAIVLLTYGRSRVNSLPSRLSARASEYSRAVVAFVTSLGQILIPMIGIALLIRAIQATTFPSVWMTPVLDAVPVAAVMFFGGLWLANTLFPRHAIAYDTLQMTVAARTKAYRMTTTLSVLIAISHVVATAILPPSGAYSRVGDATNRIPLDISDGAASVFYFILIVLAGIALFRLGNALRTLTKREDAASLPLRHRVLSWAGTLTRIAVVLVFLFGAGGFINLANTVLWPWIYTLALIAMLIVLQDFIADLFSMLKRGEEGAREGLVPLLIGFLLFIPAFPILMIIWGARGTELSEMWGRFQGGVSFSGIRLSPVSVLTLIVLFSIGYMITRAVQGGLRNSVLPKTKLDAGGQNAVVSGVGYVGIFLAALWAITSAGIDLSSLAILASALSVGIGFGLQNIVSNFVSGIILMIERPVSVGDWIEAGGKQGIVKRISVRSTMVETFDRTEVIVPNSDLISQPVTNWTRDSKVGRIIIPIGVAYGSDTRKVERILREIIEDQPLVTIDPPPAVLFRAFGADSMDFEIRAILSDVGAGMGVTSEVLHQIADRFEKEKIEIPFAQRDVWLRNPEALKVDATVVEDDVAPEKAASDDAAPTTGNEEGAAKSPEEIGRRYDRQLTFDEDGNDAGGSDADADGDR